MTILAPGNDVGHLVKRNRKLAEHIPIRARVPRTKNHHSMPREHGEREKDHFNAPAS